VVIGWLEITGSDSESGAIGDKSGWDFVPSANEPNFAVGGSKLDILSSTLEGGCSEVKVDAWALLGTELWGLESWLDYGSVKTRGSIRIGWSWWTKGKCIGAVNGESTELTVTKWEGFTWVKVESIAVTPTMEGIQSWAGNVFSSKTTYLLMMVFLEIGS